MVFIGKIVVFPGKTVVFLGKNGTSPPLSKVQSALAAQRERRGLKAARAAQVGWTRWWTLAAVVFVGGFGFGMFWFSFGCCCLVLVFGFVLFLGLFFGFGLAWPLVFCFSWLVGCCLLSVLGQAEAEHLEKAQRVWSCRTLFG